MEDAKAIGARIRKARIDKGLTQVELAAAIGVSRSHLTNVEGGNDSLSLEKLSLLASETGTTVAWLIGESFSFDRDRVDLLAAYELMNEEQRHALLTMAKGVVRRETTEETRPLTRHHAPNTALSPVPSRCRRNAHGGEQPMHG